MSLGLTAIYEKQIAREERKTGEPLDLLRTMLAIAPGTVTRLFAAIPLFNYRRETPAEALEVARLAAMRAEDCGPCVQIQIAQARRSGVATETIRKTVTGCFDALDGDLATVARFADAISRNLSSVTDLGNRIEERYGKTVRLELSLAAATARFYPAMKRGLGMAESCALLKLDD